MRVRAGLELLGDVDPVECSTRDVSEGGLLVRTVVPLAAPRRGFLVLAPDDGPPIGAFIEVLEESVIIDSGEVEARLRFLRLPDDSRERLLALLRKVSEPQSEG